MSFLNCNINDEWSTLKTVIVGTAESWGPNPSAEQAVDPTSRHHVLAGTYPKEDDVQLELSALVTLLESEGVEVLRPEVVKDLNQVFSRDVGVVITDKLVRTSMIADRTPEWDGISSIFNELSPLKILNPPKGVRVEGGDVMPMKSEIWVGYGDREDFGEYKTELI
jgi:N-dimethylarginine dimethylaminohydrolase